VELSKKLPLFYRQLARECGTAFLDAGKFIKTSLWTVFTWNLRNTVSWRRRRRTR
jgi:hypothetical protein